MKKTLLTLGAVAALTLALASCSSKKDCNCSIYVDDEKVQELFEKDAPTVTDFDGDCDEVKASDLPATWANVLDLIEDASIVCEED